MATPKHIVVYDGDCRLCNQSVARVRRADRESRFDYLSVQQLVGDGRLPANVQLGITGDEVALWSHNHLYLGSEAVVQILKLLGGGYRLLGAALGIIPLKARSRAYRFIAQNRHLWQRRKNICTTQL